MHAFFSMPDQRTWLRLKFPAAILITLLQRSPALRVLQVAGEIIASAPLGVVLKSTAALASLGALHSLAGATVLQTTQASPASATVGTAINPIGFTVTDTINIASWKISGSLPPGLRLDATQGGASLTGPGMLDATTPGVSNGYGGTTGGITTTTPVLRGTPSQAGSFTFSLQAFELPGARGLTSGTFSYTVNVAAATSGTAPSFTTQPAPQTATAGGTITFTAAASGSPAPAYQWQKNGNAISGATNATLMLTNVQTSDAGTYTVVATNSAGTQTSNAVTLAVTAPPSGSTAPAIARQPVTQSIATGGTVVFTVDATGSPAPTFQWRRNGTPISGATSATLVIRNASAADVGAYSVVAQNSADSATSSAANLALSSTTNFGHLINLSIRTTLTASDPTFTLGTVIGGGGTSGTKALLVRAVGPTLGAFGVASAIADAKLDMFAGSNVVASNDDWGGGAALSDAFASVGAFPLASAASKDAAVFNPGLAARDYTVQVSAVGGATGEVLAELYDASSSATFGATTPRLVNVSVRKTIGDSETLIAGFTVGGTTSRTVLVRAIGPTLAGFGVSGTMADPQLALFSGDTKIAENDDWGGDAQLTTIGSSVGAFGVSDTKSKDAILLITLAPGGYTAQVKGNGGGGQALVEIYEVP